MMIDRRADAMTISPDVTSVLHASYHDLTVTDRIVIDNPYGNCSSDVLAVVWVSGLSRQRRTAVYPYR